jgi:hypothetical protein
MGSSVWVGVAVPVGGILQALSITIQMMERKRDFIVYTPLIE